LRLFLMAGLILADELQEARSGEAPARPAEAPPSDAGVAEALNAVAARIEKIAQTIT
jgi:cell division protein ZapA